MAVARSLVLRADMVTMTGNTNTPYTVWAAPKIKGVQFGPSAWRPFGPFTFSGRQRVIFNWDGASHGGRMASNTEITGTTTILSPALASLHVQNFDGNNVWIIVNPLPPGCGLNTGGNPRELDVSGTWAASPDATATFTQQGKSLQIQGSAKVNGVVCRWHGTGTIQGNTFTSTCIFDNIYPGGNAHNSSGIWVVTVSPDGQSMAINWTNNGGVAGTATYNRVRR
jgi:hypothetical protein